MARLIPTAFQGRRTLRHLNVAAIGFALACVTGSVVGTLFAEWSVAYSMVSFVIAIPTFFIGTAWAALLHSRATFGQSRFRLGWGLSLPLAIVNAQLACILVLSVVRGTPVVESVASGIMFGATFGGLVWVPALVLTLVCFGVPIARAQSLAEKGLAGEEKGELIVGTNSAAMAAIGLSLSFWMPSMSSVSEVPALFAPIRIFGYLGVAAGATAAYLAWTRAKQRRDFVRDVEAGAITGFRVDEGREGKVLIRVSSRGEGYRVSDFREELFELDASGEATRAPGREMRT